MSRRVPPNEDPSLSEPLRVDYINQCLDLMESHQVSLREALFRRDHRLAKCHWENIRSIAKHLSGTLEELVAGAEQATAKKKDAA